MYFMCNVLDNVENLTNFKQLCNVNVISVLCNVTE